MKKLALIFCLLLQNKSRRISGCEEDDTNYK